jgi:hypothetical protein
MDLFFTRMLLDRGKAKCTSFKGNNEFTGGISCVNGDVAVAIVDIAFTALVVLV